MRLGGSPHINRGMAWAPLMFWQRVRETTIFIKTYGKGTLFLITYVRRCGSSHLNCTPGAVCARARFFFWENCGMRSFVTLRFTALSLGLVPKCFPSNHSCLSASRSYRFLYKLFYLFVTSIYVIDSLYSFYLSKYLRCLLNPNGGFEYEIRLSIVRQKFLEYHYGFA